MSSIISYLLSFFYRPIPLLLLDHSYYRHLLHRHQPHRIVITLMRPNPNINMYSTCARRCIFKKSLNLSINLPQCAMSLTLDLKKIRVGFSFIITPACPAVICQNALSSARIGKPISFALFSKMHAQKVTHSFADFYLLWSFCNCAPADYHHKNH